MHVFSANGRYVRSFGHVPVVPNPMVREFISGGILSPARNGGIWYTQNAPYLIERYSSDGTLEVQIQRPNDFLPSAESALRIEVSGERTTYSVPAPFARAAAIQELDDGTVLNQVLLPTQRVVTDVFKQDSKGAWALIGSYLHAGPVLVRRAGDGMFLSLVTSEGMRFGGVMLVRYTPRARP